MRKTIYKFVNKILDILYPRRCAICDCTISNHGGVCCLCRDKIVLIKDATCMKCGKTLKSQADVFCYDCKRSLKHFDRGYAVFEYEYIKESIFRFKYSNRPEYCHFYAKYAVRQFGDVLRGLGVEALVPVPIHKKRERKRGYNQAFEFANSISKMIDIPVENDLVVRKINTIPLKRLKASQRQKNLKKAFKLTRNDVKFRKVCIVDDIYTTGATIDTIAGLLKGAGVREVYFVTIAIGRGI